MFFANLILEVVLSNFHRMQIIFIISLRVGLTFSFSCQGLLLPVVRASAIALVIRTVIKDAISITSLRIEHPVRLGLRRLFSSFL